MKPSEEIPNHLVDVHSHRESSGSYPTVVNLTFADAEEFFSSGKTGTVSAGIHPWQSDRAPEEFLRLLEQWVSDPRLVAIGECGLDKHCKASKEQQIAVFLRHIKLSEKSGKPLIVHCVGYFNELLELRKKLKPQQLWIIHGFRGKPELAAQVLKSGCSLSFGEQFNPDSVKVTTLENLFVETDESSLPLPEIFKRIAQAKGCRPEELNAGQLFWRKIHSSG